jgi:predicted DNA-binding antitoxin AbrB/MazE fold protein
MTLTIEAIYENGVLRPAQALPLKEHEKVAIVIHTQAGGPVDKPQMLLPGDARMAALQRLLTMGLPAEEWERMEEEITQGALE